MADTLTQLITRVQAALLDSGTLFSTATCTAAIREALKQFNFRAPIHAATIINVVSGQKEYELSDFDVNAYNIIDILQQDTGGEDDVSLDYDAYIEDERLFFRLRSALSTGTIIARYTLLHTITGLDSAVQSTLSTFYDQILVGGAAAQACFIRGRARVEANNLDKASSDNYIEQARELQKIFERDLAQISARRQVPVSEPDLRAWNDDWHGFNQ